MKKHIILTISILLLSTNNVSPISAAVPKQSTTNVSASIGEYRFTLYGVTSPFALVTFEGMGIYDQTYADKDGKFIFNNRFSPFIPREACITAQDQLGRTSQPLCLPTFPTSYNVNIGPVILPATLSLNKDIYYVRDEVILAGQSVPKSTIKLSMFKDKDRLLQIFNPRSFKFPTVSAETDAKGNFSVALPSAQASEYRLFTQTEVAKETSPRSLTLHLDIMPIWMIILNFLILVWNSIQTRIIEAAIIIELTVVSLYLLYKFLHPASIRALVLREHFGIKKYKNNDKALEIQPPHKIIKTTK